SSAPSRRRSEASGRYGSRALPREARKALPRSRVEEIPMRSTIVASALLCGVMVLGSETRAQAPPSASPAPVPEVMPFIIPYGTPIGIDRAKQVAAAVIAEAKRHPGWKEAVAVVGPAGELIYFEKMDDAQIAAIAIAQHKARVAATF